MTKADVLDVLGRVVLAGLAVKGMVAWQTRRDDGGWAWRFFCSSAYPLFEAVLLLAVVALCIEGIDVD